MLPKDTALRVCETCGNHLSGTQKRYCSKACRDARMASRTYTCETCGKSFHPNTRTQRVCSTDCITGRGVKLTPVILTCKGCEKTFVAKKSLEKTKTYCSRACYRQSRERLITCERCGIQFKRRDSAARPSRYCSNACKRSGWDAPKSCNYCGSVFTPTRQNQRFCSTQCSALFRHEHDLATGKRIALPIRARCHKTLTSAVVERDGAVCHICNAPIDIALSGRHQMGLTIDHVIPLARGGSHTLGNLKPAHRVCNQRKSSTLPDDVRTP